MNAFAKSFELSSCAAARVGPNILQPRRTKGVDDARRQRRLRADESSGAMCSRCANATSAGIVVDAAR